MSLPYVDIIIPNFNKEAYLKSCINSVFSQTYKNWNIIFVDDSSTDNSLKIIKKYKSKKIKIISLDKNKGPSFCRHTGVKVSKNNYIAFLDFDDKWTKNKLKDQIIFMIENKYNFTYSDYYISYNAQFNIQNFTNLTNFFNYKKFITNSSINTSTIIIKKNLLKNIPFTNLKLLEDYVFKCQILKKGFVAHKIQKPLAFYNLNESNRSKNKIKNLIYLWNVNKKYNKLGFFENMNSLIGISYNSFRKYGFKK